MRNGNAALPRICSTREQLTLNQRVQGSSPCAPTNHFNDLAHRKPIEGLLVSALCPKPHGRLAISEGR